jgi:hypothetical protein
MFDRGEPSEWRGPFPRPLEMSVTLLKHILSGFAAVAITGAIGSAKALAQNAISLLKSRT